VKRFVVFGAVGFGIGWAVIGTFALTAPMWPYFVAGAGLGYLERRGLGGEVPRVR
jgi:hypothetical protein